MLRLSLVLLALTLPLLPATPYAGIPLWAWASMGISLLYGIVLIFAVENEWDDGIQDG